MTGRSAMQDPMTQFMTLPLSFDPVGGPPIPPISCSPDKVHTVGRSSTCEVQLPDKAVSRGHAMVRSRAGAWTITDLGSKHGTFLNGVRLEHNEAAPLRQGDLLSIDPWTFRIRIGGERPKGVATTNDMTVVTQRVHTVEAADLASLAQQRLALLIDCASAIQNVADEAALAATVLRSALEGTGFTRAAVLRSTNNLETVEVVARLPEDLPTTGHSTKTGVFFSRTLLRAASSGEVVSLTDDAGSNAQMAMSIVTLAVESAVCAPIKLGNAIDAFLYVDARQGEHVVHAQSVAFVKSLAQMYGTALGNLKRLDVERMRGQMKAELEAAGAAQSMILPKETGTVGRIGYAFKSRPGRFASGDLFDVVEMPGGRVGMFLGDVSGKGVAAALVMAMAQTHLHACLSHGMSAKDSICSVNRHIGTRCKGGQFITLWLGVFDPAAGVLEWVDAGHGYWGIRPPGQLPFKPDGDAGLVLGVDEDYVYESHRVELQPQTRVMVCSDGVVEQPSPAGEQFGRERSLEVLHPCGSTEEDVATIVQAVLDYAQTELLADDVTAASVVCL